MPSSLSLADSPSLLFRPSFLPTWSPPDPAQLEIELTQIGGQRHWSAYVSPLVTSSFFLCPSYVAPLAASPLSSLTCSSQL